MLCGSHYIIIVRAVQGTLTRLCCMVRSLLRNIPQLMEQDLGPGAPLAVVVIDAGQVF